MLRQLFLVLGLAAPIAAQEPRIEIVESPPPGGVVGAAPDPYGLPGYGHADYAKYVFPPTRYHHPELFINGQYFVSTLDMPLHLPYPPAAMGYYYFRPYNHLHIPAQQAEVVRWGGDPRHPYDNKVFEMVYEKLGVEQGPWQPTLNEPVEPTPAEDSLPNPDSTPAMGRLPELRFDSDDRYFDVQERRQEMRSRRTVYPGMTTNR